MGLVPAIVAVPLIADSSLRSGVLRGLGKPIVGIIPDHVIRPATHAFFLGSIALFVGFGSAQLSVNDALWLYAASFGIAWLAGAIWLNREVSGYHQKGEDYDHTREKGLWLASLAPMMLMGGVNTINYHMDIVLLQQFTGEEQVGLYKVALSAVALVSIGLAAANSVLAPRYGEAFHRGNIGELTRTARLAVWVALLTSLPILLIFLSVPSQAIGFLFGDVYRDAGGVLSILAVGHFFNVVGGPCGLILRMSGNERAASKAVVMTSLLNIVANLVLIPRFGAIGGAMATSFSFTAMNVWMYLQVRSIVGAKYIL